MASNNQDTPLKRLADRFNDRDKGLPRSTTNSPTTSSVNQQIRMVVLGKTGNGKSSLGNLLLGCQNKQEEKFLTDESPESVTEKCSTVSVTIDQKELLVVDTPGFCDTKAKTADDKKRLTSEITDTVLALKPGPQIFLIVLGRDRFTEQDLECLEIVRKLFDGDIFKYSVVVFTRNDQCKKPIDQYLEKAQPALKTFLQKCENRYVSINADPESSDERKVMRDEVMKMIEKTVSQNNFGYFTSKLVNKVVDLYKMNKEGVGRLRPLGPASGTTTVSLHSKEEVLKKIHAVVEEHVSAVLDKK